MGKIVFYEKPGCINNSRQKALLQAWGNELDIRDLTTENWTRTSLGKYFQGAPAQEWFNPTAPALKSGSFQPSGKSRDQVLDAMIKDPLLIRRPLINCGAFYSFGFELGQLQKHMRVMDLDSTADLETCPKQ